MAQVARTTTPPKRLGIAPVLSPSRIPPPDISGLSTSLQGHVGLDVFSPVDQNGSFCFDRVIKSSKVNRRVKKKGAFRASWKPTYLVLRPNLLSIYGNADETDLRDSIGLSDITAIARVRKSRHDNVFGVFSPSKNYHFQAASERDAIDWVSQIRLEARIDGGESQDPALEPPAPQFSRTAANDSSQSYGYDTTDVSADESPDASASPEQRRKTTSSRPRTHSNIEPYTSGPDFNTSHSDFSDFQPGTSLPKNLPSASRPLSPIPSANALRPAMTERNPSQFSITHDTQHSRRQPHSSGGIPTTPAIAYDQRDPLRPIRQGFLTVLSSKPAGIKSWKSLFAVLRPKNLSFYKNENEYSVLRMISASSIIEAVEIDPVSRSRVYCFEVIAEEKVVRCCVKSEAELEGWLGAFKSVIMGVKRERERELELWAEKERFKDKEKMKEVSAGSGSSPTVVEGMNRLSVH
jgi:hypothetical protein